MRYRIHTHIDRPSREVIDQYASLAVADLCDALGRNAAFPSALKPLGCGRMIGTAYTVNLPASENLLLYFAVDNAQAGDVLVVSCAGYTERAVTGEIMANYARSRKLAGFVIDGAVRDAEALRKLDFPVYTRAISPNGPYKGSCGEINVPISMGNIVIMPGDIIVADDDGIVAIHQDEFLTAAAKAKSIAEKNNEKLLQAQHGVMDLDWLYAKLKSTGCKISDN